jgi:hypothetical protein
VKVLGLVAIDEEFPGGCVKNFVGCFHGPVGAAGLRRRKPAAIWLEDDDQEKDNENEC